ncbi:MAG: hypothetical protein H6559_21510 [Lewinellaceae bacterium]|nr:hypothetical protein [Lewinellaceae bacterium]
MQFADTLFLSKEVGSHPNAARKRNGAFGKAHEDNQKEKLYNLKVYFQFLTDFYCGNSIANCNGENPENGFSHSLPAELSEEDKEKAYKITFLLQSFIIFLTYRSNGTPKKLAGLVENYIVPNSPALQADRQNDTALHVFLDGKKKDENSQLFLRFKFNDQYEICLTANLYLTVSYYSQPVPESTG